MRSRIGLLNEERAFIARVERSTEGYLEAGIYAVWSPDKTRVYVGEAQDIHARWHDGHKTAILLGCIPEVLTKLPNSPKEARLIAEREAIKKLRNDGVLVVNT